MDKEPMDPITSMFKFVWYCFLLMGTIAVLQVMACSCGLTEKPCAAPVGSKNWDFYK